MLVVCKFNGARKLRVAEVTSFEEARAEIARISAIVVFEQDMDNLDCADAFTCDGQIWTVEPEGFKAEAWQ